MQRKEKMQYRPLCPRCLETITLWLGELERLNENAKCRKNKYFNCNPIHEAKSELIKDFRLFVKENSNGILGNEK